MLDPRVIGDRDYEVVRSTQRLLQDHKGPHNIIAILGMYKVSENDKLTVSRARKVQRVLSQSFNVTEVFTRTAGIIVHIEETIQGLSKIIN